MIARGIVAALLIAGAAACLGEACNQSIADGSGYKILRITPNVRWGAPLAAGEPVKPGEEYSQANVNLAQSYVIEQMKAQESATLALLARVSARYVTTCTVVEPAESCRKALGTDKCVTLRVDVYSVQIPSMDVAPLNLSAPHASTDTYLDGVPGALLALSPKAGLGTDAALGTTLRVATQTDLAQMMAAFRGNPATSAKGGAHRYGAQVAAAGFRAVDAGYYSGSVGLNANLTLHGALKQAKAEFNYSADLRPLGEGKVRSNTLKAGLSATVLVGQPVVRTLLLRGAYNHSASAVVGGGEAAGLHEDGLLAQLATDGVFQSATVRSSVWFQRNSTVANQSERKLVVRAGLERGIPVRLHETVDFALLGGYGRADGMVPAQDRFAGGSTGASFLDERLDSAAMAEIPTGPIQRSFGAGRLDWVGSAATSGEQSFGHANLTVGIPVGLSRPLIPVFEVFDGKTVADVLKARVDKDNLLEASLKAQGYSDADAKREQDRVMNSVRPAVHYIADQANLWSVKPIVLVDWARVRVGSSDAASRTGLGGGVQFGVVTAQFQAAYIHSVGGGPSAGNFVFRLSFQNLF